MNRVFFATCAQHSGLTSDDLFAAAALADRGVTVTPLVWTAATPSALTGAGGVVIRSCWDSHVQPEAFVKWLTDLASAGVPAINGVPLLQWNFHKRYLSELEAMGAPVVPTILVGPSSDHVVLEQLLATAGWREAVIKPAISLSAYETWRVGIGDSQEHQDRFHRLRLRRDVLIQRYVPEVSTAGEWSLVFFQGEYSHAVLKLPAHDDFRVQQEHGGRADLANPSWQLIQGATDVLNLLPTTPIYARVDLVEARSGVLLMELECIDPVLFFNQHSAGAAVFADAIVRQISAWA